MALRINITNQPWNMRHEQNIDPQQNPRSEEKNVARADECLEG